MIILNNSIKFIFWNKNRQLHGAVLWRCKDNKKHKQKFQMLVFKKYQTHIITGIVYIRTRVFYLNIICVGYLPPDLLSKPKYLVVTGTVSENTTVWKVESPPTDAGCVKSVWARMSFQFCWRLGNKLAGLQFPGKPLSRAAKLSLGKLKFLGRPSLDIHPPYLRGKLNSKCVD